MSSALDGYRDANAKLRGPPGAPAVPRRNLRSEHKAHRHPRSKVIVADGPFVLTNRP